MRILLALYSFMIDLPLLHQGHSSLSYLLVTMAADASPKPLRDLMRDHGSLFVNLLLWTPRHLDFVGCHFQDDTANEERDGKAVEDQRGTSLDVEEIARNLFHINKHRSLVNILVGEGHAFARIR